MDLTTIQKVADDILSITIQWATNIAKAACEVMSKEIKNQSFTSLEELESFFLQWRKMLEEARSTEPMLFNAMKYAEYTYKKGTSTDIEIRKNELAKAFDDYLELIKSNDKRIMDTAAQIVRTANKVFTHCHSSTVTRTLIQAHKNNPDLKVWNTETRPLYQGRKTSKELVDAGIKTTMVTDSSAPYFIDRKVEHDVDVDMVILWCDAIKRNGNIVNKVGSFSISLSAHTSEIPVYIEANLLKVDVNNTVKIETRWWEELWPEAPKELTIINYAFDTVPWEYIAWLVTEFWIISPSDVEKIVHQYYPWMI